ncbi:TonB-dependent receptor [Luteimonas sp. 50]|uniref:TonB-dependent receptor n=1 Tax=Cognatiluteimonas sedimenti TaxID=2927791 RepID=A0ABT0A443_9GAMM|nr:TonB-dependent receptor [Lysobacter sedimenti]MCJ0825741.1 TonB-dependent receptor [Lysobacter sedimenti]
MASKNLAKGLKRSALTAALGLCFVGGAYAQTNAAGAITGSANPGDTITVTNASRGFSRTITVGADGNYRFSALPTGQYEVSDNGGAARPVTVNVGTSSTVNFTSGDATTLGTVTVVGTNQVNPIDVSSVESTTILTAEQIAKIPVPRDGTSVALLAPGTVRGDSAFGNLASFGGSSVAENQYYLNGFNITNTFANLNFVQVPFEGIAEQQVKTGGYGAEFGRSTGGVLNQITKRGSNEFHAGGNIFYSPESLDGNPHDLFLNDGTLVRDRSENSSWDATAAIWASGALVKDRLFAYGLLQYGKSESDAYPGVLEGGSNIASSQKRPNWLLKMDWNINDSNILELTSMSDTRKTDTDYFETNFDADGKPSRGDYLGTDYSESGGDFYVLKYTGYLTDTFTLSALAGHGTFKRNNYSVSANGLTNSYSGNVGGAVPGCPLVIDGRPPSQKDVTGVYSGCDLASQLGRPDAQDTRDQYRIDAEWQLGDHLLRGGVDIDNFESVAGESYSGGIYWRYIQDGVVRKRVFQSGATVEVDQTAYYIEDSWSITDNFIAYLGLRWDTFENKNGNGETFAKISNQFAPRLGFSWDVFGDSTFKVFGNAGRYALPLTATVAVRGASASLFSEEYYTYTGVATDGTGAPTGIAPIPGTFRYLNNEFGVGKNPATIASSTLDPMYQDEYILGFQKQLTDNVSLGVRGIYRDLKRAIDDTCDYRPIIDWALANGFTANDGIFQAPEDRSAPNEMAFYNPGFPFCRLYNPGQDSVYHMDVNGDGVLETIPVSAEDAGAGAKRTYSALEFFFQGNWDRFFLQGSYTYAKSKGNTEGGVKSDIGQSDTGTTQDFDYPELTYGAYGYLPNDRRHTLKLFGNYEITDEWSVGANLLVQSGRPVNCFGAYGARPDHGYGNGYFSCDPGVPDADQNNGYTIVPRGSQGTTPWTKTLDLNVAYQPAFAPGLQFKVDVFNVFNAQSASTFDEFGEDAAGNPTPETYKRATEYQAPRSVRFMVQYDF